MIMKLVFESNGMRQVGCSDQMPFCCVSICILLWKELRKIDGALQGERVLVA